MATHRPYKKKQWETLEFAPLWVADGVATADHGEFGGQEWEAFRQEVAEASRYKSPLVREVLIALGSDLENRVHRYNDDKRSINKALQEVAAIVDKRASQEEALAFKQAMIGIGIRVAKASRGDTFSGKPVSDEAGTVLAIAARDLGLTEAQLQISDEDVRD